jgi:hypothetical protein
VPVKGVCEKHDEFAEPVQATTELEGVYKGGLLRSMTNSQSLCRKPQSLYRGLARSTMNSYGKSPNPCLATYRVRLEWSLSRTN